MLGLDLLEILQGQHKGLDLLQGMVSIWDPYQGQSPEVILVTQAFKSEIPGFVWGLFI